MGLLADTIRRHMDEAADEALRDLAHEVKRLAIANMPVGDPHLDPQPAVALRNRVEIHKIASGYQLVIAAPYVIRQHENTHLRHPRGGGAKFLERAMLTIAPQMDRAITARVDHHLSSGRMWGKTIGTG